VSTAKRPKGPGGKRSPRKRISVKRPWADWMPPGEIPKEHEFTPLFPVLSLGGE
jgi:hypothetical protein